MSGDFGRKRVLDTDARAQPLERIGISMYFKSLESVGIHFKALERTGIDFHSFSSRTRGPLGARVLPRLGRGQLAAPHARGARRPGPGKE